MKDKIDEIEEAIMEKVKKRIDEVGAFIDKLEEVIEDIDKRIYEISKEALDTEDIKKLREILLKVNLLYKIRTILRKLMMDKAIRGASTLLAGEDIVSALEENEDVKKLTA